MATHVGQITHREKDQSNCNIHKGRQLELYCEECDTLVCFQCLSSTHQGHGVCELSNVAFRKKQDIQNFIDRTEQNDLVQLRKYITSTETLFEDNNRNFEQLSMKLRMQTDELKQMLDRITEQTLCTYRQIEQNNVRLIQTYRQNLEMYERQLKQRLYECKTALQRSSDIEIYDTGYEICSETNFPVKPALSIASFTPNQTPHHHLESALGKFTVIDEGQASTDQQEPPFTQQQPEPKKKETVTMYKLLPQTTVLGEWTSPVGIDSICPTNDGQVWTSCCSTLVLLDRKGTIIQRVNHKTNINDISLSPTTQTLWVCDTEYNILELVFGQLTQRFSTVERPRCICVTASGHVILGMTNIIAKFTTQGQMIPITSVSLTKKTFVCSPRRISECPVTRNLVVIDGNYKVDGGDGRRHVIVMDTDFKELFVYGSGIPIGTGPFNPWGVVYDSVGNIFIGDCNNSRVLLISGRGEFLKIIHTDTSNAWTVGIDRDNILWAVFGWDVKLLQYSSL